MSASHDPPLRRVRLDLAYDGTDFLGWARQRDRRTVQDVLEEALAVITRLAAVTLTVAGRTDAGVHASGQVAHMDLPSQTWDALERSLVRRLAGVLPGDVRVHTAVVAPDAFHARFSASWRRYEYRLTDAPWGADPLRRRDVVAAPRRLEHTAMAQAAARMVGEHDFAAFCRRREGATTVRGLQQLDVRREANLIVVEARADAFCHSMVRSLVGALLAVGEGRRPVEWPASLLTEQSRSSSIAVAPAHGLTLCEVMYPRDDLLAARSLVTRNRRSRAD